MQLDGAVPDVELPEGLIRRGRWRVRKPLGDELVPPPRAFSGYVQIQDTLYVFGGEGRTEILRDLLCFFLILSENGSFSKL